MTEELGSLPPHVSDPDPSIYWSDNYVVLDFETTTELKGSPVADGNRIVLSCWNTGKVSEVKHTFDSEYGQAQLVEAVERADFVIAHNAKFELGWLKRCGVDLRKIVVYDTMIAEYVLGGNTKRIQDLGLEKTLNRRGLEGKAGPVNWMIKQGFPVEDIPKKWLLKYCERDVEGCHEVFLQQREELKELQLEAVNYQRCLLTPALADIEFNGMQLDKEKVLELEKQEEAKYVTLTNSLTSLCEGIAPSEAKRLAEYVYNVLGFRVPKDYRGRDLLTATGKYSVASEVMERLVPRTSTQRDFLNLYKEWSASNGHLTKYLRKFGDCVREADGLLYGVFNQCTTRTHRLSSGGAKYRVQFQNFARSLKPLFCARNSAWSIGEADGAQLEFRTAVHLGRDKVGLRYITEEGSDIHRFSASQLLNISEYAISNVQRQSAKAETFKPLYGGSSGSPEQQRYYAAFKEKYKGISDAQLGWLHTVLRDKTLRTEWGLRYYWPDTKLQKSGYITNTTSIYNYPVQAFATAEIIPCAIIAAWHRMSGMQSFLVNTVHDSIIAEVPPDEAELWHRISKQCLITDAYGLISRLYGISLTVPLGAGVMLSSNWGDQAAKDSEVVYEAPDELWLEAAKQAGML